LEKNPFYQGLQCALWQNVFGSTKNLDKNSVCETFNLATMGTLKNSKIFVDQKLLVVRLDQREIKARSNLHDWCFPLDHSVSTEKSASFYVWQKFVLLFLKQDAGTS